MRILLLPALLLGLGCLPPAEPYRPEAEIAAARVVFERNLQAIQDKNREAYLGCYRADPRLVRAGDDGVSLGFADLASGTSTAPETWPTRLEASEMSLHPVAPGVVYGSYHYEVEIEGKVSSGWSERVFVKTPDGFRIAVTTAFGL